MLVGGSERAPSPTRCTIEANGRELHRALIDSLQPQVPVADYYRHHPWCEDAGYLLDLVEACRRRCADLPSFDAGSAALGGELERKQVLALNHIVPDRARDAALEAWAREDVPNPAGLVWFELSAAASASLVVHALLALAAEHQVSDNDVTTTFNAYWPWPSLAAAMLDSFVDQTDDLGAGNHSYVAHYLTAVDARCRIGECVFRALLDIGPCRNRNRHTVVVASMIAMYLSKDSARTGEGRRATRYFLLKGGSLPRLLWPVLRIWRSLYGLRQA